MAVGCREGAQEGCDDDSDFSGLVRPREPRVRCNK